MTSPFHAFWAQAAQTQAPSAGPPALPAEAPPTWLSFVPMLLIGVIFYFVLIRPQVKAKKQLDSIVSGVKAGDHVATNGGIVGVITQVKDKTVIVRTGDNVKLEVLKTHLASVTREEREEEGKTAPP